MKNCSYLSIEVLNQVFCFLAFVSKIKVAIKVVYNKDKVKEKYGDISEDDLYKNIWNQIKEVNKTLPPYKYIKHMILTDKPLIKTTTQKIKRKEEIKTVI